MIRKLCWFWFVLQLLTIRCAWCQNRIKKAICPGNQAYDNKLLVAPIISYAPETKLSFGFGGQYVYKVKNCDIRQTNPSNSSFSFRYTTNNQIIIRSKHNIFFNENKWNFNGKLSYTKFPIFFYGVGNDTPISNEELISYRTIHIEPVLLFNAFRNVFLGGGYRVNAIFNVNREKNGFLEQEKPHGYDGVVSSGFVLVQKYDSRDNQFGSSKGSYLELREIFNQRTWGSDFNFQVYEVDARTYFKPFKNRLDVLAFQGYGYFSSDNTPFTELALLGGPSIMRGYYQGRYRDNHLLALQAEYRLHIKGRVGMVAFAGVGDVDSGTPSVNLKHLKHSVGLGFRFTVIKSENMNLRFDYAFGRDSNNFYFGVSEAF